MPQAGRPAEELSDGPSRACMSCAVEETTHVHSGIREEPAWRSAFCTGLLFWLARSTTVLTLSTVSGHSCGPWFFVPRDSGRDCPAGQREISVVHCLRPVVLRSVLVVGAVLGLGSSAAHAADPFADQVVGYTPGSLFSPGYNFAATALGSPERFTGEGIFPSVVTPFNPAFLATEIVALGAGGVLTLGFDEPIRDDASNPFGLDLIVFGNTFFADGSYPQGVASGVFGPYADSVVSVSANGADWITLGGSLNLSGGGALSGSSGSLALTAGGTNQNITLTPSGAGVVTTPAAFRAGGALNIIRANQGV